MATSNKKTKILINTPYLKLHGLGGVGNHYLGLRDYWSGEVVYNQVGKRNRGAKKGFLYLPYDIIKFIFYIFSFKPNVILLNPSIAKSAINRDFIFLNIAKFFGKKVVIFTHGFNKDNIKKIGENRLANNFNKCESIILLAKEFETIVRSWGVNVPIYLSTTKVDDKLINDFDITKRNGTVKNILFLTRITREKGIFIALDIFKELNNSNPSLTMTVVGYGSDLEEAKEYCKENSINNIIFKGALSGVELINSFKEGDLYLFTSYHEGMPTSVLEAMAFGLPIVTRPVGGLVDFFTDDMGKMVDSFDSKDFIPIIESYINNPNLCKKTSFFNHNYAKNNFLASSVVRKIESILKKLNI